MKYLDKETCEYLVSLGCTSENQACYDFDSSIPMFSLEDILRKDNAEKIFERAGFSGLDSYARRIVWCFQLNPDTWPEEVAKLIKP